MGPGNRGQHRSRHRKDKEASIITRAPVFQETMLLVPSIACPPRCFSRLHWGAAAALDSRVARRGVAPSPGGAAARRGRNPGSSPGARPGSAARLLPGPGALLGPSARRAPAAGRVCARTYGRRLRAPRVPAGAQTYPSSPFKAGRRPRGGPGACGQIQPRDAKENHGCSGARWRRRPMPAARRAAGGRNWLP